MLCYFLGDSITDCGHLWEPENLGHGYVRILQERFGKEGLHQMVNKGQDGFTARMVAQRTAHMFDTVSVDVITLLIGINDVCEYVQGCGSTPESFRRYLEEIIAAAKEQTEHVILMEPFLIPWPEEYANWVPALREYQAQMREAAAEHACIFVGLQECFDRVFAGERRKEWSSDGTHPSGEGHMLIADTWQLKVAECFKLC